MSIVDDAHQHISDVTSDIEDSGLVPWLIYLPSVVILTALFIVPVGLMTLASVYPNFTGVAETGLTLQFYEQALNPIYLGALWRSIWYGLLTTLACLVLGYPVVYAAVKVFRKYEVLILLLSVLPFWIMYLIRMFGWIDILKNGGLIDEVIELLGLGISVDLMHSAEAVVIGLIFSWYPLMVFPLYASIKSLDDELLEASKDLGANSYRTFRRVTFPQTKSGILAGSILVFVPSFGSYVTPILLGGPQSSQMLANIVGRQFNEAFNWPLGAALGTIMMIVVLGSLILVQRYATVVEVQSE